MVQAAKVFVLPPLAPEDIAKRMRGFSKLKRENLAGREIEIGSSILDLYSEDGKLIGTFEENLLLSLKYKDEVLRAPLTVRTPFIFVRGEGVTHLIVAARKNRANRIAGQLSSIISDEKGFIQEAWIPSEEFRKLYEGRMGTVKVIFFSDVRIPNVRKLSLYGEELASTSLYQEYLKLGRVWYVVFEPEDGLIVGLTRNCAVTFFSRVSLEEAVAFIEREILPRVTE
ncbi:MAG: hypothetical protein LM591_07520 [Candidatus Korarchaeum sp.]|nr:hypothetical protein [Candidatus Korarchaeum sp.]